MNQENEIVDRISYNVKLKFKYKRSSNIKMLLYDWTVTDNDLDEIKQQPIYYIIDNCAKFLSQCINKTENFTIGFHPNIIDTEKQETEIPLNTVFVIAQKDIDTPATSNTDQCIACMDKRKIILFKDCGHLCLCNGCSYKISECPMCKKISEKIRVFY
jgi:hypothetical protein